MDWCMIHWSIETVIIWSPEQGSLPQKALIYFCNNTFFRRNVHFIETPLTGVLKVTIAQFPTLFEMSSETYYDQNKIACSLERNTIYSIYIHQCLQWLAKETWSQYYFISPNCPVNENECQVSNVKDRCGCAWWILRSFSSFCKLYSLFKETVCSVIPRFLFSSEKPTRWRKDNNSDSDVFF